ncbi:MAG: type II secretion system F family protein [Candidatus Omnitrophica bacterium]|nr:type II secretion system F family protein [Candidatus Omnitrophota bacterium]MCF7893729.1 type II secretion system F family protein [Candidatus Omnitrophota bacterium]
MEHFSYTVKNQEGEVLKGTIEAESKNALVQHLQAKDFIILSINKIRKKTKTKKGKVSTDDLVVFSRQLTTLIESGIPAVEALGILEDQIENPYFKGVIASVLRDVKEGTSFSKALMKYPHVFPEIYLSMVEAAEISGNLPEVLNRVSVYLEKSSALRKKVKSALYYPTAIVIMAIVITGFLMFKVIPTFKQIFESLGGTLPLPTQILIGISDLLTKKETLLIIIGGLGLAGFGFKKYTNTSKGKLNFHRFILKIPLIGELIRKIALANFSRTFATLMRSGVSVIQGLDIVAKTSGNKVIEEAVLKSKKYIQEGQPIYVPLEESGVFPPMVVKMIAVGERSGRLEGMLLKIAQFYEEQTDAMVAGLSSLIEPIIIVFLGVVVGGIVVALFLPILKITEYVGGV